MVRVRHRQLITTINVIRNLLPVTCYISPAIIYILFRQLLQEAEFCHIPFFCLSISEYRICNSIFISYSIRHYSAYLCLFSSHLQNHLHKITPIYFSERLLPSPGILSGYPSSAISHQRPHVSPEALRGTGGHPSFHIPSLSVAYPVHIYRCRLIFHKSTSGFLCLIIQC